MNLCFLVGKIITDIQFNFVCNKKCISIAKCNIQLSNKSIIEIYGYNEKADYLYSKLKVNDIILIEGKLSENKVEIISIKK